MNEDRLKYIQSEIQENSTTKSFELEYKMQEQQVLGQRSDEYCPEVSMAILSLNRYLPR